MTIRINQVDPATVRGWRQAGEAVLIDVRENPEWQVEHIPGATLLPLSSFDPAKLPDVTGKKLVIHCRSGVRCGQASEILRRSGYDGEVNRMSGGIIAWKEMGGETEPG